ncbi:PLDc N-terminal domain-containing protein [Haloarchaeobius sp. HRN-SO-5]|uniref:PLDc N-terminal domain-containing protein n=1 Tax=Haloarchaeobius sp. HRN-SO-5 TaxID=3446118 RepID=UPI003EBFF824
MAGEAIVAVFALLFALVILVVPIVWVYQDAHTNSSHSPALWALILFFAGPLIGLILYFIFGRDRRGGGGHPHY